MDFPPTDPKAQAGSAAAAWGGAGIAWVLERLGIHAWSDVAAIVATVYTLMLIADWCWKKWKGRYATDPGNP
jgi:hypothetical protein